MAVAIDLEDANVLILAVLPDGKIFRRVPKIYERHGKICERQGDTSWRRYPREGKGWEMNLPHGTLTYIPDESDCFWTYF